MLSRFWTSQSLVKSLYSDCMETTCRKYDAYEAEQNPASGLYSL